MRNFFDLNFDLATQNDPSPHKISHLFLLAFTSLLPSKPPIERTATKVTLSDAGSNCHECCLHTYLCAAQSVAAPPFLFTFASRPDSLYLRSLTPTSLVSHLEHHVRPTGYASSVGTSQISLTAESRPGRAVDSICVHTRERSINSHRFSLHCATREYPPSSSHSQH